MAEVIRGPARDWRTRLQRYRLRAEVCDDCGKHIFPPRDVCPHCAMVGQRGLIDTQTYLEPDFRVKLEDEIIVL